MTLQMQEIIKRNSFFTYLIDTVTYITDTLSLLSPTGTCTWY
jgi:hypothetical protein